MTPDGMRRLARAMHAGRADLAERATLVQAAQDEDCDGPEDFPGASGETYRRVARRGGC